MKQFIKFFKYLWYDKPSLWLWFIFILASIGYADTDLTVTGLLAIAVLNVTFMVNERGKFIDRVIAFSDKYDVRGLLLELNLRPNKKRITDRHWFETLVIVILVAGGAFMAGMVFYGFIIKK